MPSFNLKKSDTFFVIIEGLILVSAFVFYDVLVVASNSVFSWFTVLALQWGYLGAGLIALAGNFTILLPVPYIVGIFTLGTIPELNPIIIGVIAGLFATLGELVSYFVGQGIGTLDYIEENKERLEVVNSFLERKYGGFLTVFLFALTPLPDDLLYIPLGMVRYPFRKAAIACFLGKTIFMSGLAIAGFYYNLGITLFFPSDSVSTPVSFALTLVGIALACYLLVRIDWVTMFNRFTMPKSEK